jgi:Flp pilus assembly protein TadG
MLIRREAIRVTVRPDSKKLGAARGQALIETAILLPFLLFLSFNAINFGYFFYVAINLSSAPRDGATYSIQGFATPEQTDLPTATSVSTLVYDNLTSGLPNSSTTPVQVCTAALGRSDTTYIANCSNFGTGSVTYTPDVDPEAPTFTLNRVDVTYTVQPLIPGRIFGITVLPTYTFHRQVSMRALN